MTGGASHHRARVLLAFMLLGAGCAAPPAPSPPRLLPSAGPTIEAQDRLLHTARSHLSEGSYEAAGDVLRRLIETHPQSPLLLEGHWWLARSYEQAGDLYAALRVAPHPTFDRQGENLICELPVPMTLATMGGDVEISTLDGTERIRVEPGTESGTVIRLRGKGVPHLGRELRVDILEA